MKCSVIIHLGRRSENTTSRTYLMMNCIKNHFNPKEYLHGTSAPARGMEIHLYLMVNTDGVSIFCSSNFSLWPVNFVITGLPPEKRCQIYIFLMLSIGQFITVGGLKVNVWNGIYSVNLNPK